MPTQSLHNNVIVFSHLLEVQLCCVHVCTLTIPYSITPYSIQSVTNASCRCSSKSVTLSTSFYRETVDLEDL